MCQTRILVVDDEPDIRTILRRLLMREGFCVAEAGDGLEAIDAAQRCDVQAIVMDINMPRMTGIEALRQLRDDPRFARTPTLLISGNVAGPSLMGLGRIDDTLYLSKPFNLDQALQTIVDMARKGQ